MGEPPAPRRASQEGATLLELLVALVLGSILLGSAVGMLGMLTRAAERAMDRWDRSEAVRTVWVVAERELRPGMPGRDWWVTAEGALELRAFRGFARVCGPEAEPGVHPVAWRGDRLPVADRDSLLVLGGDGGWRRAALVRWREAAATDPEDPDGDGADDGTGCGGVPGERTGWMRWSGAGSEPPVMVRLFERGVYSFQDGAFRYARDASPRQPLTPAIFGPGSRFIAEPGGVAVEMRFDGSPPGSGTTGTTPLTIRLGFPEQEA
jgi:prepilin-type N-terminal cleavage/methylation domain-containing protein